MSLRKPSPSNEPIRSGEDASVRQRIVTEARTRFFSLGIRGVTMDDLAYDLGMSKRTLYQYFRTKTDLVEAAFRDKFNSVENDLAAISAESSSDCLGAIHRLLACIQRHMEELQPPLLRDVRREAPMVFEVVERHRSDMLNRHFGNILREGRNAGIIREDVPIRLLIAIALAAVQAIMNPEKLAQLELTPKEGLTSILSVILQGAMTPGGKLHDGS